ncbi:MAG TPA: hypothetical protein PK915_12985, partial [Bacteroidales bacterium]|nr:hypothetical protein [Bacteroidales bacterium]
ATKQEISKTEFSGGEETVRFFTRLGFQVEYHKNTIIPKLSHNAAPESKIASKPGRTLPRRSLGAVRQKNALQRLLQENFGKIETEKKFVWLRTPDQDNLPSEYVEIVTALSNYRQHEGFKKSNYPLSCDIVIEKQKIIIEYDERQHFSKARRITLEHYPENIHLHYSKEIWLEACDRINAIDNDPIDRDERRAYYDTVRDIEAHRNGYTLLRIKHGDCDWEEQEAELYLKNLISFKSKINDTPAGKHKIARLIVTGKDYDEHVNPYINRLTALIEKFIFKYHGKQQFEYLVTPGGFLTFKFPLNIRHGISISYAEKHLIPVLQQEADRTINSFFKGLSTDIYIKLKEIADYFTIGIDGRNSINKQHIEFVAVFDLKQEEVIQWTGKFYPTEQQKKDLIKINDLNTHFIKLNHQNLLILGCHDLNVFSPRGQATASPDGWKKRTADRFKKLCKEFNPDIVLQHPHSTDTPNIWNAAWRELERELPNVKHFASGINYSNKTGVRASLNSVLQKTQKGDVIDFCFD